VLNLKKKNRQPLYFMIKFTCDGESGQKITRDVCKMHSTRERLSSYWVRIKDFLLSPIEEEVGSLTNKQQQLITALEVIRIEDFVAPHVGVGRPPEDRLPMARAFIAKAIYGHTTTRQLLDQLQTDVRLRRICGWAHHVQTQKSSTSHGKTQSDKTQKRCVQH
jgi:hypothetical protein